VQCPSPGRVARATSRRRATSGEERAIAFTALAEAVSWVRHELPYAVEAPDQQRLFYQDEGVERAWHER